MEIQVLRTDLSKIQPFRELFLKENNFQIRYDACHVRGWSDSYLLTVDDVEAGYGSVKGKNALANRDAIFEFYLIPEFHPNTESIFSVLLQTSGARYIESQSNEAVLTSLLNKYSFNIQSDVVLFGDDRLTHFEKPEVVFRPRKKKDIIFEHTLEPPGDYVLEKEGMIIGTGGFMLHYNFPFADLYMEMKENYRRMGFGTFLLQELKKVCYQAGRVPAARCHINNTASKSSLLKAGLKICGYMMSGEIHR